jgi:hypothetical protein
MRPGVNAPLEVSWDRYIVLCEVVAEDPRNEGECVSTAVPRHFLDTAEAGEHSRFWS